MKKMLGGILTLSGLLILLHGQSTNSVRTQLVGTWRFVSSTQRLTDGTLRPDPQTGKKGEGYLIYTETGRVCVVVDNPERTRWTSVQTPTEAEVRNAFDGLVAYAGTFEVNESERSVTHQIEVDRVPNQTGTDRKRFCSFSGNRLVLSAAPPLPNGVREWTIVWERVGKWDARPKHRVSISFFARAAELLSHPPMPKGIPLTLTLSQREREQRGRLSRFVRPLFCRQTDDDSPSPFGRGRG